MTLPAKTENVGFIRNCIAGFCIPLDPTLDTLNDVKTAVSEAITNCVVHAYDEGGDVDILCEIEDTVLKVTIHDTGKGIADISQAMEDFYTTSTEEERSGLGFTIMKTYMDDLRVESKVGAGTTVILKKNMR